MLTTLAVPLWAEAPLRTIEVSMCFGTCTDALRRTFRERGEIKLGWSLADIGVKPQDLDGDVTDASNYGMYVDSVSPPVVAFVYRKFFDYQAPDDHRWVSADGQPVDDFNKPLPSGAGKSIWPNASHDHTKERLRHEERARAEWIGLLNVWPFILAALVFAMLVLHGGWPRLCDKIGVALVFCGFAALLYYSGKLTLYPYGVASNALGFGICAAFLMTTLDAQIMRHRSARQ